MGRSVLILLQTWITKAIGAYHQTCQACHKSPIWRLTKCQIGRPKAGFDCPKYMDFWTSTRDLTCVEVVLVWRFYWCNRGVFACDDRRTGSMQGKHWNWNKKRHRTWNMHTHTQRFCQCIYSTVHHHNIHNITNIFTQYNMHVHVCRGMHGSFFPLVTGLVVFTHWCVSYWVWDCQLSKKDSPIAEFWISLAIQHVDCLSYDFGVNSRC